VFISNSLSVYRWWRCYFLFFGKQREVFHSCFSPAFCCNKSRKSFGFPLQSDLFNKV